MRDEDRQEALLRLLGDVCDELHEDDGVPRARRNQGRRRHRRSRARQRFRKRAQLTAQVERELRWFLADLDDEALPPLTLRGLEPAPDTDHLRAIVSPPPPEPGEVVDLAALQRRVSAHAADARRWIAQQIHRKRAPYISFAVVPAA